MKLKNKKFLIPAFLFLVFLFSAVPVSAEWDASNYSIFGLSNYSVSGLIRNLMLWILSIVGFIAIIAFVISGIQYLTSAGSEDQITTAKRNMKWSVVGVVVALAGLIIITAASRFLGGWTWF